MGTVQLRERPPTRASRLGYYFSAPDATGGAGSCEVDAMRCGGGGGARSAADLLGARRIMCLGPDRVSAASRAPRVRRSRPRGTLSPTMQKGPRSSTRAERRVAGGRSLSCTVPIDSFLVLGCPHPREGARRSACDAHRHALKRPCDAHRRVPRRPCEAHRHAPKRRRCTPPRPQEALRGTPPRPKEEAMHTTTPSLDLDDPAWEHVMVAL